jgi:pimeloyl-ACP methyl ester carboxylesterase
MVRVVSAVARAPFVRGRFEELPELPHRPHPYARVEARTVDVTTDALGPLPVHVRVHGQGPPLLLVHGLMTSSYSWRYVLEPLGRRFTCYAPDLPGNGRTPAPAAPLHPDALATWLAALQRALGIRGCPVIGNSMGGYLCMRLALRDPGAMSRLVNVHSPGVPEARLYALNTLLHVPGTARMLGRIVRRDPARWVHRNVHYRDESLKSLEEAREYGAPLADAAGTRAFASYLRDTMAPGPMRAFQRELLALKQAGTPFPVPLQLLYSTEDPMVPPHIGDTLAARIPSAQFQRLQATSHFAHVDDPDGFLAPALAFLTVAS